MALGDPAVGGELLDDDLIELIALRTQPGLAWL
jgi:hypothetical protein